MNNKFGYLAKNTILFTISSFGSKILSFLLVPLYTSVLSTSEYGIANVIGTTASLLFFVVSLNIPDAVLRYTIERKENQQEVLAVGIKTIVIGNTILLLVLGVIHFLGITSWNWWMFVFLYLIVFSNAINQVMSNYMRAVDKVFIVACAGIISTLSIIITNILTLLVFKLGLVGYLISLSIGNFSSALFITIAGREFKTNIFKIKIEKNTTRGMFKFSIPLIFNGIAWWINSSIDVYFLELMCGSDQNGIYSAATKIPTILSTFVNIFSQAWNLSALREFDKNDTDGFFSKTYTLYNATLVVVCSILIGLNTFLAKVLFAKDFYVAWNYSSILLYSSLFSALSTFLGSIFGAVKDSKIFAVSTIIAAMVNVSLNAILIPRFQVFGAAIATVVSFIVIFLIRIICARKYIKWKINYIKDVLAYCLLIAQIILEHLAKPFCYFQYVCVMIIIILYYREFFSSVFDLVKKVLKRNRG